MIILWLLFRVDRKGLHRWDLNWPKRSVLTALLLHTAERQMLDCVDCHLSVARNGLSDAAPLLTAGRHV